MTLDAVPTCVVAEASYSGDETVLVMRVCGELDIDSRTSIEPAIMAAVATARSVILDLAELTFCDSTGLSMFCALREKAIAEETQLAIRDAVGFVRKLFALSGIDAMFDLID